MQLRIFKKVVDHFKGKEKIRFKIVGSCRHEDDEKLLMVLKKHCI